MHSGHPSAAQHAAFGFLTPSDVYDKMRAVRTSADALNQDILGANIANPAFVQAWRAWFQNWNDFFERNYQKVATILHVGEVNDRTEEFKTQLGNPSDLSSGWYGDYRRQKRTDGSAVPLPSGRPPVPTPKEQENGGSIVPWWLWMLGGVAVVGVGYYAYQRYLDAQHAKRVIQREVLPGLIGPGLAHASARDATRAFSRQPPAFSPRMGSGRDRYLIGRDVEPARNPLRMESYTKAPPLRYYDEGYEQEQGRDADYDGGEGYYR